METGVFIFFIALLLSVTTWLDRFFFTLRIKKAMANMYILAVLALNTVVIYASPIITISIGAVAGIVGLFIACVCKKQLDLILYLLSAFAFSGFCILFAFLLPKISVFVPACLFVVLFSCWTHKNNPLLSALTGATVPVIFYFVSAVLEILYFVPYKNLDGNSLFTMQAVLIASSLMTWFLALEFGKKRKITPTSSI